MRREVRPKFQIFNAVLTRWYMEAIQRTCATLILIYI